MDDRSRPYVAFLVRLWPVSTADVWRASATDPHTGRQELFIDLQSLFAFLQSETRKLDVVGGTALERIDLDDGQSDGVFGER